MEPPHDFLCPITHEMMRDPVACAFGHVYERKAIECWLATHDTSPMTNEVLPSKVLKPLHYLRNVIETWEEIEKNLLRVQELLQQKEEIGKRLLRVLWELVLHKYPKRGNKEGFTYVPSTFT
jgi:hypothetical protein